MKTRGFTMVEMLMATALAGVLMVGVMTVVVRLYSPPESSVQSLATGRGLDRWVHLLNRELSSAQSLQVAADQSTLTLTGPLGLDQVQRQSTHRPVQLRYRLVVIAGGTWLLREQESLDESTNQRMQRDLVGGPFQRLQFVVLPTARVTSPSSSASTLTRLRLRLWHADAVEPVLDRLLLSNAGVSP